MSRIGKRTIQIPDKTEVTQAGDVITVKGPKGTLTRTFHPAIEIKINGKEITMTPKDMECFNVGNNRCAPHEHDQRCERIIY
jgi:large subunit ribosomal protein L6